MIVCSDCLHHNPDDSTYCESCGVPLPFSSSCSNCGAPVETKAHFCGQCGFNLQLARRTSLTDAKSTKVNELLPEPPLPELVLTYDEPENENLPELLQKSSFAEGLDETDDIEGENTSSTRIQNQAITLLHVQSNTSIDLKAFQKIVRIGKPNDRLPPDINVSVLPNAEVVSRVHAAIHLDGDRCFVEDLESANGTYVNDSRLTAGRKHPLRKDDRICLGKGDLVTFIFQLS
jgi:FHA domain/Double zinc ribbon